MNSEFVLIASKLAEKMQWFLVGLNLNDEVYGCNAPRMLRYCNRFDIKNKDVI